MDCGLGTSSSPLWIAAVFLAGGLLGCRSGEHSRSLVERQGGGEVVFNLASEPTTLDPARATRLPDLRVIGQCLEGLTRLGAGRQPEPAAAESWEISPDGRTYRFRLRRAHWSNGQPVLSNDFAFAWRRVLDPHTRAYWADLFFAIEGARTFYRASPQERARLPLGIETPDDVIVLKAEYCKTPGEILRLIKKGAGL